MPIRNSVKVLIIENEQLLCIEYEDERGIYYGLPGGGQDYQENLHDAIRRECLEEISAQVEIGPLLFVREYIGKNYPHLPKYDHVHMVELIFRCNLKAGEQPAVGPIADSKQIGVRWVPMSELQAHSFEPHDLLPFLSDLRPKAGPVYVGDLN